MKRYSFPALGAAGLVLAACGGDNPDSGRLTLAVTDAPVDGASKVVVQFTGVEIKPAGGASIRFDFDEPRTIDLLALQGGGSAIILDGVVVPAGAYNWLRLDVDAEDDGTLDSFIELSDGTLHELDVPSGAETGLKLVSGFIVPAGGEADYTVDFDLRKSVHEPMNASDSYTLRPALRLVNNVEVGEIEGTVDATQITEGCTPAVYVFGGAGVAPDDVDGAAAEPVTTATVALASGSGVYEYRAAFLLPGDYTLAFTCGAAVDDPATDDVLVFSPAQDASVTADETTVVGF